MPKIGEIVEDDQMKKIIAISRNSWSRAIGDITIRGLGQLVISLFQLVISLFSLVISLFHFLAIGDIIFRFGDITFLFGDITFPFSGNW
jgi:hypothetical protein